MKPSKNGDNLYEFGPFCLDAIERVLLREGRLVPIPAKALSTLLMLVRNSKHLVEKDVLMKEVWPDEFVEEGNLAQHIFMLRKALGETNEGRKYIETIPRRGYRFLETVREISEATKQIRLNQEQEQPTSKRHTENSDAYQSYLKGRYCWSKYTTTGLEEAIAWFRQTINLDPGFALGYAAIVDCYLRLATNYLPPADDPPKTRAKSEPTEFDELAQDRPFLEVRREWDWKSAERECMRAIDLKSSYPAAHQWYAAYMFARRLYEDRGAMNWSQEPDRALDNATPTFDARLLDNIRFSRPTPAEEVQVFCTVAREQIDAGNYEAACAVLQRWWTLGGWPQLEGLSPHSSADLLFTVGTLAGNLVSTRQVPKGQKHAEALLNGSIALFEQLSAKKRSAEGRIELSLCYHREGLFDLARTALLAALDELSDNDRELKSLGLIRLASLEHTAGRLHDALTRLNEAADTVESTGPWATGRYRLELASTLKDLAISENHHTEYFDRALKHYTEALYEFEAVGHHRLAGIVENNYGYLLLTLRRLDEAEPHLVRARRLFDGFGDKVRCAQVDETMAQLHIARQQFELAEQVIMRSVETLEMGGEDPILAESLRTQAVVLCKLGRYHQAQRILERAQQVAEHCDDMDGAQRALQIKMEVVEQLSQDLRRSQQRLFALEMQVTEADMAGGIANELRKVLAGSKLMLDQALVVDGHGQPLHHFLQILDAATTRGLDLTRQAMADGKLGQQQSGPEAFNFSDLISSVTDEFREEFIAQGVSIEYKSDESSMFVIGDEAQFYWVVKNLILNARDALIDPAAEKSDRRIKVVTAQQGDSCTLVVADNGIGIPQENLEKIFGPFFSTKPTGGLGLGLSMVQKVVSRHNGSIGLSSKVGTGTSFTIVLPRSQNDVASERQDGDEP